MKKKVFLLTLLLVLSSCGKSTSDTSIRSSSNNLTTSEIISTSIDKTSSNTTTSGKEPSTSIHTTSISSHEHTFDNEYDYDETYHWYPSTCGHKETEEKIKHTFKSKIVDPTYEEGGYTIYECNDCEYSYVDDETNPLEHNYSKKLSYDEYTHWYACIDKGYEKLKKDEKAHSFTSKVTQPTYEEGGYTTYECNDCEYSYKDNFTENLKHNYSNILSYDEYEHWYACTDKGYEELKKDSKPHDFEEVVTPSTYFEKGYTSYQCKYCEYNYKDKYTELLTHSITYNLDGGVNSSLNPDSFTIEDEIVFQPASKEGYTFVGWFDKNGNPVYKIEIGTNVDIEITAKWVDVFTIEGNTLVHVDGSIPVYQIDIPNGITTIGANAFSECEYLAVVSIPASVTKMEAGAFDGCSNLSAVIYKGTLDQWSQITFDYVSATPMYVAESFYLIDSYNQYYEVTEIELSDSITEIKKYAFSGFSNVTSVLIPKNVSILNYFSFKECISLKEINFKENSVLKTIGESAFYGCTSLEKIALPNGIETIDKYAFEECENLSSISLPETLKTIGEGAFKNNHALASIKIPSGITKISEYTFIGCTSLSSVEIPNTVKTIEGYAFRLCYGLEKLDIPNSVTTIGNYAFSSCEELKSVRIPNSVTSMGINAFQDCSLAIIYCQAKSKPSGWDTTWNPSFCTVYWGKSSSDIYEKDGVEYIVYNSTGYVSSYLDTNENVILEKTININGSNYSVATIGESAFANRDNLKTITIPNSIVKIESHAFSGSELEYIVLPSSVKTIGRNAFYLCFDLTIYCEVSAAQSSWDSEWNSWDCQVYYKGQWEYDENGVPTVINK